MDDFNPYAAPEVGVTESRLATEADEGRGVWRDGDVLVMAKIARLPSRCVKCNEPATYRLKRSLSWHTPWLYLMILFPGLLFYVIVALIVRKTAKVEVPLCEEHRARRSRSIGRAWFIALAGIALLFSPAVITADWVGFLILLGVVVLLVGMIFGSLASQVVSPAKIDATHAWLRKVDRRYLDDLAPLPGTEARHGMAKAGAKISPDEL